MLKWFSKSSFEFPKSLKCDFCENKLKYCSRYIFIVSNEN